jgi:hypothetical protein
MSDKVIDYSFTRIDTYNGCKFRYKLRYIDGNYPKSDAIALSYGTAVHKAEESIAKNILADQPIDYVNIKNKFITETRKMAYTFVEDYFTPGKSGKTYAEKTHDYLTYGIYRLEKTLKDNPSWRLLGTEIPFRFQYNGNDYFKGSIDRAFLDTATNTYIIQDIKTWDERDESKLKDPLQFVVYTMAIKKLYNITTEEIRCQYDLPLLDTVMELKDKNYMNSGIKKLDKLFKGIEAQEFDPKPSPLCHWCEFCKTNKNALEEKNYKYLCPYHSLWTRENPVRLTENVWLGLENHEAVKNSYFKKLGLIGNTTEGGE